jgi:hypothetical protein
VGCYGITHTTHSVGACFFGHLVLKNRTFGFGDYNWYRRNAGRFVFVPEQLRLTFTPPQALALNTLLLACNFDCDAARTLSRNIVGLIYLKI